MILFSAFQFSSFAMLGWLAAALLPWLIHRFFRYHAHSTPWAAIELLAQALKKQSRRVNFQQWLLLAVRTLIIALVAIAAAEPSWVSFGAGSINSGHDHLILVLDQSYSMSCRQENQSRLQRAKQHAQQRIAQSQAQLYSVIGWGHSPRNITARPTSESSLASAAVEGIQQLQSSVSLSQAMSAVSKAIDRAEQDQPHIKQHHVVFLSDRTKTTWSSDQSILSELQALSPQATFEFVDVGDPRRDNLAITDFALDAGVVQRQQPIIVTATFEAFGNQSWQKQTVEFKIDGQLIESKSLDFSPGKQQTLQFTYQFVDEGSHIAQVSLAETPDALRADNRRWRVIKVVPKPRIACVAGTPNSAQQIASALSPYSDLVAANNPFQVEIIPESQISSLSLTDFELIFLCNTGVLTAGDETQLAAYLDLGGTIALFAGEKTRLSARLADRLSISIDPTVPAGDYHFDPLDHKHPILKPFRGQTTSGLAQININKYRKLRWKSTQRPQDLVFAFDNGDPALIVEPVGKGQMAVLAIPASLATRSDESNPWSTFTMSPSFLPLMRELVNNLLGSTTSKHNNVLVHQSATCSWDPTRQSVPIEVRGPGNQVQQLPASGQEDANQVFLTETTQSGIYTLSVGKEEFAKVAVNIDTRESNLVTVDVQDLPTDIQANSSTTKTTIGIASVGNSLARPLIILVVLLMLFETALACWQGRAWQ